MADRVQSLDDRQIRHIAEHLTDEMEKLAAIPVSGFGELISDRNAKHSDWLSFVQESQHAPVSARWVGVEIADRLRAAQAAIGECVERFQCLTGSTLCWGDISPDNIILDADDHFSGIIDFESIMAAEPLLNVGYFRARFGNAAFYHSFAPLLSPRQSSEPRSALYAVLRVLRLMAHDVDRLPTGARRDPIERVFPGLNNAIDELLAWTRPFQVVC